MPLIPVAALQPGHSQSTANAYEMHLDLGSIQGESSSTAHPNEIELSGFSWGLTRGGNVSDTSGKVSMTEVTVTKFIDKSSVQLVRAACMNQVFKTAKISWSKSTGGKKPEDFMVYTLTRVLVAAVNQSAAHGGQGMGTETVTLSFDKIGIDYKQHGKDGLMTSAGEVEYDLARAKSMK
jgi:type VI secretion system secreted protein Hcp